MKLYTNKFPISKGFTPVQHDNTVLEEDVEMLFPEGKVFKVLCMNAQEVLLTCEGKVIPVVPSMLQVGFEETEITV